MFPALKDAQGKLDAARKSLAEVLSEAGPDYDLSKIKSVDGDNAAKLGWVRTKNDEIDALKADVDQLLQVERAAGLAAETKGREPGSDPKPEKKAFRSLGDAFVDSQAFKGYAAGQGVGPVAHLDVSLKTLFQTSAGWDPEDTRTGHLELIATRPAPVVVDALPQTTTGQSTVVYMEETTFTNNAAEAAEAGTYGEGALALTEKTSEVRKIAVWLPVTDEQFEDEPRARDYVNNRLPFMLRQRLDLQVLTGDGTAPNLRGTENVSGIQTQALGTDPIPDAIYKVMRKIRDDGFAEPSVVFIRPEKWETVRLLRTTEGMYIWGHPSVPGPETIWGVPVVQTTAVTSTKAVVGDYRNFSELAVRRGVDVQMTNAHSTFFVEGKQAIRCDVRVALVHYRPKAFGTVTGL